MNWVSCVKKLSYGDHTTDTNTDTTTIIKLKLRFVIIKTTEERCSAALVLPAALLGSLPPEQSKLNRNKFATIRNNNEHSEKTQSRGGGRQSGLEFVLSAMPHATS